jgi:hypothetical protein
VHASVPKYGVTSEVKVQSDEGEAEDDADEDELVVVVVFVVVGPGPIDVAGGATTPDIAPKRTRNDRDFIIITQKERKRGCV